MSSKQNILSVIRTHVVPSAELPSLEQSWIRFDDPLAQFQTLLESVGGRFVRVPNRAAIAGELEKVPEFVSAREIVSNVPDVTATIEPSRLIALAAIDDPHTLETIDWAILPAEFGVAENGAVWVTDGQLRQRAIYFITQHLVLVLAADRLVHNMHEAYARLTLGESSLGVFISGPSKTADIEQSLVIGAHGPRSMTLFCVDPTLS